MEASTEAVEPRLEATAPEITPPARRWRADWLERYRFVMLVYFATRVVLIATAIVDGWIHTRSFTHEIGNWDGFWYQTLAHTGYPTHISHAQTVLGFFPLYSIVIWLVAPLVFGSVVTAGFIISMIGGLIATVIVQKLATGWWDEQSGRRAAVLFCMFPGSVVFSMVYSEGLLLPLIAGCIYALERRRWLLAGVLAGFATAIGPDALVIVPVCAVSALLELRRRGWRDPAALKSFLAPLLSLTGVAAFAVYLWVHVGTPTASLTAQRYGWHEKTDPFAIVHLFTRLARQIRLSQPINLNYVVGIIGTGILIAAIVLMLRRRGRVSIEALLWTLGVGFLMVTSEYVPPNPRLLITAFPAVIVYARYLEGRWWKWLMVAMGLLLIELSALTFVGVTLRP
jgi:Mannosyltransferase (PIG-V)